MINFLIRTYRRIFNKCPECGAPLYVSLPKISFNEAAGDDPPYHGTIKTVSLSCLRLKCLWHDTREKFINAP